MKVLMIGSHMCQDTLFAVIQLRNAGIQIDFRDIHAGFPGLLELLSVRESSPLYDAVRAEGGLGIPYFRMEDGTETLDLQEVLNKASAE